ncbi:MAG: alpha/beta fold hydrolase [Verrucomicrobiales bacterium]|nr:alpha/beta fold hydrolase [Verrucomicrobiales bacterium]
MHEAFGGFEQSYGMKKSRPLLLLGAIGVACMMTTGSAQQPGAPLGPAPGAVLDIGGHKLHIHCAGPTNATATIVFESGGGGYSKDWSRVRELLPSHVRTCAYDRAGSGWSEAGPTPRTMRQEVFELHALFEAAKVSGPVVLVGQSIGGLLARLYTAQYGSNIVGLVLVDPAHESGVLGSVRYGGWVRLREKATGKAVPEPRREGKAATQDNPEDDYMAEEFQQIHLARQVNPVPLGDRPLIVLGAGKRRQPPGTSDELWKELRRERDAQIMDLERLSRNSKVIIDPASGHAIHLDNPQLVAQAVQEVLEAAVKGTPIQAAEPEFVAAANSPIKLKGGGHNFVLAELNGDQKPDLLVCTRTNLTVLFGHGRGKFEPSPNGPAHLPHGASEMVTGDFNRDGHLDWAGAHHDHYDVIVMLGKGNGEFTPAPGSPVVARDYGKRPHTHGLATGDLNGDGILDLVTANNEDNDVSVLLGDGNGGFAKGRDSPFPVGRSPYPIALADVNGDQHLDLAAPNSGPGVRTLTVLLGDGHGAFRPAPQSPFPAVGNAFFVTVADLNGDQKADLIATHDEDEFATFLLGDGTGGFRRAPNSPIKLGNRAWQIIAIDLNNDGNVDLIGAGQNAVAVLLGNGRGDFRPAKGSPFPSGKGNWRLAVADLNGDGKLDLVTNNVESNDISVLLMK